MRAAAPDADGCGGRDVAERKGAAAAGFCGSGKREPATRVVCGSGEEGRAALLSPFKRRCRTGPALKGRKETEAEAR